MESVKGIAYVSLCLRDRPALASDIEIADAFGVSPVRASAGPDDDHLLPLSVCGEQPSYLKFPNGGSSVEGKSLQYRCARRYVGARRGHREKDDSVIHEVHSGNRP